MMQHFPKSIVLVLIALTGAACQFLPVVNTPVLSAEPMVKVSGSVTYRQRIAAPKDSHVVVKWLDVSIADAAAKVVAEKEIPLAGQSVPVDYSLEVARGLLQPQRRYVIRAEIRGQDKRLLWTTDSSHQFDIGPASQTLSPIVLVPVRQRQQSPDTTDTLAGEWRVEAIDGRGVIDNSATSIDLSRAGRISGRAGCNTYSAPVNLKPGLIAIEAIAATKKLCPPALQDQELRFLALLSGVSRYRIDSTGALILSTDDGREIRAHR